jgi:hypothetical protein
MRYHQPKEEAYLKRQMKIHLLLSHAIKPRPDDPCKCEGKFYVGRFYKRHAGDCGITEYNTCHHDKYFTRQKQHYSRDPRRDASADLKYQEGITYLREKGYINV